MQNLNAFIVKIHNADFVYGTGFVIDAKTIATCAHVIVDAGQGPGGSVMVTFALTGETSTAEVLSEAWSSPEADDIAILRLSEEIPSGVRPAIIGPTNATNQHSFSSFGYPDIDKYQGYAASGKIVARVSDDRGKKMLQLDSKQITLGMSGAPVLSMRDNRVVGMISEVFSLGPDILPLRDTVYATPSETIAQYYPALPMVAPALERSRKITIAFIFLLIVGSLLAGLYFLLIPSPPLFEKGPFNVAVAELTVIDENSGTLTTSERQKLSEVLYEVIDKSVLPDSGIGFDVRPPEVGPVAGEQVESRAVQAEKLAGPNNISLLIYGVITPTDGGYVINPEFYILPDGLNFGEEIVGPNQFGRPIFVEAELLAEPSNREIANKLDNQLEVGAFQHLILGLANFYESDYIGARARFSLAIGVDPNNDVAYLMKGATSLRAYGPTMEPVQGQTLLAEAAIDFADAIKFNPDNARAYLGLAAVAYQLAIQYKPASERHLIQAESWYSKSLELADYYPEAHISTKAHYGLGQVYLARYRPVVEQRVNGDCSSGFNPVVAGKTITQAQAHFEMVIADYEAETSSELDWFAGHAFAGLGYVEGIQENWPATTDAFHNADITLSKMAKPPYDWIARYRVSIAQAERCADRFIEACAAYDQAIDLVDVVSISESRAFNDANLKKWQSEFELICSEKGSP